MDSGMSVIKTKEDFEEETKAYICPNCMCDDTNQLEKISSTYDPKFECYHGFGTVQYHIQPWYCKRCKHVFTTWTCDRTRNILKNLWSCFLYALSITTTVAFFYLGNHLDSKRHTFVGLLACCMAVYMTISQNMNQEPKDIDKYIQKRIQDDAEIKRYLKFQDHMQSYNKKFRTKTTTETPEETVIQTQERIEEIVTKPVTKSQIMYEESDGMLRAIITKDD